MKNYTMKELAELKEKIIETCERQAYPFAAVTLDSMVYEKNTVVANLLIAPNQKIKIDSIVFYGNSNINKKYLFKYIGIRPLDDYDERSIKSINNRLNEQNFNQSEPNSGILLMELASIIYNFALEQLAVTISNIYEATPQITRQLMSLITASAMVFNYMPDNIRTQYTAIPYFGPLFSIMNHVNPQAVQLQNSAAVVTTIYYLLRNAGIDTSDAIASLGSTAQQLITNCSIQMGRFVCVGTGLVANSITSVVDIIADRLGDVLTQNYNNLTLLDSQGSLAESTNTVSSISSQRTVNTLQTPDSDKTALTIQSIDSLLNTPIANGGIDFTNNIEGQIVEQRLNAIASGNESNPIINAPVQELNSVISEESFQQPSQSYPSQSLTEITQSDMESQENWSYWLYGHPNPNENEPTLGGKKSRRYKKTKKGVTKKNKNMKKGKINSKKLFKRKSKKTLKRKNRRKM
jgi:hypothetical protein